MEGCYGDDVAVICLAGDEEYVQRDLKSLYRVGYRLVATYMMSGEDGNLRAFAILEGREES